MKPSRYLARDITPEGKEIVLYVRDGVYSLRVDGLELMSSRAHGSEEALAEMACQDLEGHPGPRVLVAGLGFGYTLRAALDRLPANARVIVCEVFDLLIDWNRGVLGDLAGRPLEDPRVETTAADVWELLGGPERFDAVLLDVDNGPWAFTLSSNRRLYTREGLVRLAESLAAPGRFAVWSCERAPEFERRLRRAGFAVETRRVPARGSRGPRHTLIGGSRSGTDL
ncbi:MAG: hypothetical protein ACE5GX_19575 [Thermoanaerobaculia bacterium]